MPDPSSDSAQSLAPDDREEPSVIEDAYMSYRDAGLRLPPVPHVLIDELDELANWFWGTDQLALDNAVEFNESASVAGGDEEIAFGLTGHGITSVWLCYRLKLSSIAVYTRAAFGGAYHDSAAALPRINRCAELLEQLIPAAAAAFEAGRFRGGHRLVIVDDELTERSWQIAGLPESRRASANPLEDALAFLAQPALRDQPETNQSF